MAKVDPLLSNDLTQHLKIIRTEESTEQTNLYFGNICRNLHTLRNRWREHRPKHYRVDCDSFVLSVCIQNSPKSLKPFLYCGLNNGDLQLWALSDDKVFAKVREQEVHSKGVKVCTHLAIWEDSGKPEF